MTKGFQRLHLRSPFMSDVLYVSEDHVHKGRTVNISEGGVLLENLPHVPEINAMPLMIALTQFPSFSQLSADYLRTMELSHFDRKIIRSKARLVGNLPLRKSLFKKLAVSLSYRQRRRSKQSLIMFK